MINSRIILLFFLFLPTLGLSGDPNSVRKAEKEIEKLLGGDGAVVLYETGGRPIFEKINDPVMIPASTQKILLAKLAIEYLGLDYRFRTAFYIDSQNNLFIQGYGDPFLVSEEIDFIAKQLKILGKEKFHSITLDDSLFRKIRLPGVYESMRPHDSLNGALIVNFNTIFLKRDRKGKVFSGEPQTPLTPTGEKLGSRISKNSQERINLGKNSKRNLRYAHELFVSIFTKAGIKIENHKFFQGKTPSELSPFYVHKNTRDLNRILRVLLKYSNNFIANQIMLVMGAEEFGYPTDLEKGVRTLNLFIRKKYGFAEENATLSEASGISRKNKISVKAMIRVLKDFRPYAYLLNFKDNVILKSGTLSGIYNYAGYFQEKDERLRPFLIYNPSAKNHRDRILKLLKTIDRAR